MSANLSSPGACGGSCACSTCHVIVTDETFYDRMPEPDDDENDMLDLASVHPPDGNLAERAQLDGPVRIGRGSATFGVDEHFQHTKSAVAAQPGNVVETPSVTAKEGRGHGQGIAASYAGHVRPTRTRPNRWRKGPCSTH